MSYSRWEYTKAQSTWHFDPLKSPEPGADSYTSIGRFSGDFASAIAQAESGLVANSWAPEFIKPWAMTSNDPRNKITAEQADLLRAGADKDGETYDRAPAHEVPLFKAISDYLGMEMSIIKYHVQRTGQYAVTHIDDYFPPGLDRWNWLQRSCGVELDPPGRQINIRRFAIMLDDWQMGQVFQVGNASWHQWRAGDCITWDWANLPHATANIGWHPRPMLQITGAETDRTRELVALANSGKYQHVAFTLPS